MTAPARGLVPLVALAAFALAALPQTASGAATCNFSAGVLGIDFGPDAGAVGNAETVATVSGGGVEACGLGTVPATVTTLDTVVVTDSSGGPSRISIDAGAGPFSPGATDEGDGSSEIEFLVDLGDDDDDTNASSLPADSIWLSLPKRTNAVLIGDRGGQLVADLNAQSELTTDFDLDLIADGIGRNARKPERILSSEHLLVFGTGADERISATGIRGLARRARVALDLRGGGGRNFLAGGQASDRLTAGSERDTLLGGPGGDLLQPDRGDDKLKGGPGPDRLEGGGGGDLLNGGGGKDRFDGGPGRDVIKARDGKRDRIDCGPGIDRGVADRKDRVAKNCEKVSKKKRR